jgi:hypothetical protein
MITVVSWLGGAASILPFAEDWFGLSTRVSNVALLATIASGVVLGLLVRASSRLEHVVERLAGPPERPARALVLVAVLASAGAGAMLALTALLGTA